MAIQSPNDFKVYIIKHLYISTPTNSRRNQKARDIGCLDIIISNHKFIFNITLCSFKISMNNGQNWRKRNIFYKLSVNLHADSIG